MSTDIYVSCIHVYEKKVINLHPLNNVPPISMTSIMYKHPCVKLYKSKQNSSGSAQHIAQVVKEFRSQIPPVSFPAFSRGESVPHKSAVVDEVSILVLSFIV